MAREPRKEENKKQRNCLGIPHVEDFYKTNYIELVVAPLPLCDLCLAHQTIAESSASLHYIT